MSTQTSEARNEIDDEPEEGEIQDDEGSLEDVSSDDEISPLAKRKERGTYTSTLVTVRGQFVKKERQHLSCTPRREMRLCPSERSDLNLKKGQTRVKSGCRTTSVLDNYYESVLRHKSSKDTQKVSGKIHEKENKAKESKKARKRSASVHASGSETRNAYIGPELAEPCISSSTSSKGYWHKGDVKEKHKKKKKSSKSNKFSNPLGEVCASQPKTGKVSSCIDECVKSGGNAKEELLSWKRTESEKEKRNLSLSSSSASDIQILDVPVVSPEVITICDSDDDALKTEEGNCDVNIAAEDDGNVCVLQLRTSSCVSPVQEVTENDDGMSPVKEVTKNDDVVSPMKEETENDGVSHVKEVTENDGVNPMKEVTENDDGIDPEDNLKLLREAALKSSRPDTCVNVNRGDEVFQLRLAALKSAVIRKFGDRKKRGITLAKTNRNAAEEQLMSISPLGSPGDSSVNASDDIDHDLNFSFEFSASSNQQRGVSEPINDSEIDKISAVDMELAESDEEKELVGTETKVANCHESNENVETEYSDSYKADSEQLERPPDEIDYLIYSVDGPIAPVASRDCSPSSVITSPLSGTICTIDPPAGYIIGDQDQERASVFVSEIHETLSPPSLFDPQSEIIENSREYGNVEGLHEEDKIHPSDQRFVEDPNFKQAPNQVHEEIVEYTLIDEIRSKSFHALDASDTVDFENSESRNTEPLDVMSSRSDSSFLSPISGELDLESMIVLDEIGKSSDEKSECSTEEVFSSEKFQNSSCKISPIISEDCASENVLELYEENSGVNLSSLICNSRSSGENVPIYSDKFEANEHNIVIFEKNSRVNPYDVTSSKSLDVNVHANPENFEICEDNIKMYESVPDLSLKILLSNSQGSNDLPSQDLNEPLRLDVCDKGDNVAMCETSNLSCSDSHSGTVRVFEISSQAVVGVGVLDNSENVLKFSSEVNGTSLGHVAEIEEGKSVMQCILSPTCEEETVCSSHNRETVHKSFKPGNDFSSSVEELQQPDHTLVTDKTFDMKNRKCISNSQESNAEDEETVLRVSLLAMLKKRTDEPSNKLPPETDLPGDDKNGDALCVPSVNRHDSTSKNILPVSLQTASHADSLCTSDYQNCNSLLKQMSASCSAETRQSFINSLPKHGVYSSHNAAAVKMRGSKSNKLRGRDAKVPGRFNVNVPKLVINLGEDSDSGEDDDSEPVKSVPISNLNGSDASEDLSGSQSVPPDFEKKLDLLLKQARFQQEISTKDDKDISCENTELAAACFNKGIKLQSTNSNADVGNSSKNIRVSSGTHTLSISKIPPLVVQGANNQRGKSTNVSMLIKDKITISGSNVNVTKTSVNRILDANKKDIHGRIKYTPAIGQQSSSISSVVDIGLLPSSKQKEYIRLKRQLAQHARKEQEIKTKENVSLVNTARLPVKKMEETKRLISADVRNSLIKNNVGIGAERSPFSRKFVRRGQGGTLISRTELGKSRRIVRSISSSYSSQTLLRNRLTVTAPNKVGGTSLEGSSIVRRVLCMPQKRIVTALTVKKVSPSFQSATPSVNANTSDIQRKIVDLGSKSNEHANTLLQEKIARTKNENEEIHISKSVAETGKKVQKKSIGKAVLVRKGSTSDVNGVLRKKIAVEQEPTKEPSKEPTNEPLLEKNILKDVHGSNVGDGSTSRHSNDVHETSIVKNTLSKRKRSNSEQSGVTVQKRPVVYESSKLQSVFGVGSNSKNSKKIDIVDRTLTEGLWYSESKLISTRYQVLEDIATVQLNLHEIERVSELRQQIIQNIQRLQEEMKHAETQLCMKDEILKVLYSEVEIAKRDIMRRQSETLLLSVECEDVGGKVHGSKYSVPNTCSDLIRNGMATISKTLQHLKDGKCAVESESEKPTLCSPGETLSRMASLPQVDQNEITENLENAGSEDSSKQNPRSYLSPLEAMRTAQEPSNDNQAVLCPYHIMGSCKDKECSYLH